MRDLALALSSFPWTWNLTRKQTQTNLLQKNDLLNALLLNETQTDESYQIFMPFNNINISPVSGWEILPRKIFLAANCRIKRFQWQLFALSTLSFSVSIENFGFTVSAQFFSLQNVFLSCKISKMHVNHSRVVVDLEKILQCGNAESKTAKNQTSWSHRWTQSVTEDWVFEHFHKRLTSNM